MIFPRNTYTSVDVEVLNVNYASFDRTLHTRWSIDKPLISLHSLLE